MMTGGVFNLRITKSDTRLVANDWKDETCFLWRTVCAEKGTGSYVQ